MSNAEIIYRHLLLSGMSQAGALGVIGNLDAESGLYSCRLQGDFTPGFVKSQEYIANIYNKSTARYIFSHDSKGWGLAQWTFYSRKEELYDFCKQHGKPLEDLETQVDFLIYEMKTVYPRLFAFLCSTDDIYTATSRVCTEYECPAVNNIEYRYNTALKIKEQLGSVEVTKKKTVGELAIEVLDKKWGDNEARRQALTAAGYDATAVQNEVNRLVKMRDKAYANVRLALEVQAGLWGDDDKARKSALEAAGHNFKAIQSIVNYL